MAWIYLIIASFGEIIGLAFINLYLMKKTVFRLILIFIPFTFGFFLLSRAMYVIPMSTAYAIWTGIGAAGAVLIGIYFFKEPATWIRILFLSFIITGAVGLKLIG